MPDRTNKNHSNSPVHCDDEHHAGWNQNHIPHLDRFTNARHRLVGIIAMVAGLACTFGWPTRNGNFISGDDQRLVTEHILVNHPSAANAWKLMTILHGDLYQPLPMLSFQLDHALAMPIPDSRFAVSARQFHLTNIALHMINSALACLIAMRITRRLSIAFLTGAMFACHPFATEPVAWISGRMILMATCFSLLTLLICLHRRGDGRGKWSYYAGLVWILSLLSKVSPTVPIAIAWCDRARGDRLPRRAWITYAILMALGIGAGGLAILATERTGALQSLEPHRYASLPIRGLLAGRYYLENYIWPSRLAGWHPPPTHVTIDSPSVIVAIVEWLAVLGLIVVAWRHSRGAFVGLGLFVILLAPFLAASSARRILAADRYMYLPMLGLHLAGATIAVQWRDWMRARLPVGFAWSLVAIPIVVVIGLWMMIGWRLAPTWTDTVRWAQRVLEVYPDDVLAYNEMARAWVFQGRPDRALDVVAKARRRWPDHPRLAAQAGQAYRLKKDWSRAVAELRFAAAHLPGHVRTQYEYASALERAGKFDEARQRWEEILDRHPGYFPAAIELAQSYLAHGEIDEALAAFESALKINPSHRDSLFESALLRIRRREWTQANRSLNVILELDPDDRPAAFHKAVVLFQLGKRQDAVDIYDRLLTEDPTQLSVRLNRAGALVAMNRVKKAESDFRMILKRQADHHQATLGLCQLLLSQRRFGEMVELWQLAGRRVGQTPERAAYLAWAYALNHQMKKSLSEIQSIPEQSPHRLFAQWVLIYDALRRGAFDQLETRLAQMRVDPILNTTQREQARMVSLAFADLPGAVRDSKAGRYTLAQLFLYQGDLIHAETTARQLANVPQADRWTRGAATLLSQIMAAKPPEAARPSQRGSSSD